MCYIHNKYLFIYPKKACHSCEKYWIEWVENFNQSNQEVPKECFDRWSYILERETVPTLGQQAEAVLSQGDSNTNTIESTNHATLPSLEISTKSATAEWLFKSSEVKRG